ncbi:MAG: hypothetical protein IT440_14695 [Phycisphaeraceae bacterium]|nr:hypothetical protein [Phycisphaeraceae bacterium]
MRRSFTTWRKGIAAALVVALSLIWISAASAESGCHRNTGPQVPGPVARADAPQQ